MNIELSRTSLPDAQGINDLSTQLGYTMSLFETTERIKEIMSSNNHTAFVALTDENIVGWIHGFRALLLESKPFVEIGGLVVDENFRSLAIGGKLVQRITSWCHENSIDDLSVRCK